jgi:C-terminal processing protease CtpA/Prc
MDLTTIKRYTTKALRSALFGAAMALMTSSCGEDRTKEYYSLIEGDVWIEEVMRSHYLWYDQMPTVKESDYFADASDFLKKLVYSKALDGKGDSFSYVEEDDDDATSRSLYMDRTSTYGFDFEMLTDPLGTSTRTLARVLFVLPDSPASEAGLQRGDWIMLVNGVQLSSNNYGYLLKGDGVTLTRVSIVTDEEEGTTAWVATDELQLTAARALEVNPFYKDSVYTVDGKKIAYLMYDSFTTGPTDEANDGTYAQEMTQRFLRFKQQQPDAFILDLRYNTGGYLSCAQQLASFLAPASALGQTFCTLKYNDITEPQESSLALSTEYATGNLDLTQVYILTSKFTASASEAVINCLRPYLGTENVITVGETTYGKPVAMQAFRNESQGFTLWPVTAWVLNAEGEADYAKGIAPTYPLSERSQLTLYPIGDTRELLLGNAISLITTGHLMDVDPDEGVGPEEEQAFSSLDGKALRGMVKIGQ